MNCEAARADNIAEKYVLGQLEEPAQTAFEEHFFACAACLNDVRMLQAIQNTRLTPKIRSPRPVVWAGLAAAIAAGIFGAVVLIKPARNLETKAAPQPAILQADTASPSILPLLAQFEPPVYTASRLRGATGPGSPSDARFHAAMKLYSAGDYPAAADSLRKVAAANPAAPGPRFYLGVCDLLAGRTDEGVAELRAVAELGATPYLEQARFFLAKGLLAKQDVAAASRELELTMELRGDRAPEARQLLERLRSLPGAR